MPIHVEVIDAWHSDAAVLSGLAVFSAVIVLHRPIGKYALQKFSQWSAPGGPLKQERTWAEQEIKKRIESLKTKTGNADADLEHLTDTQFVELMARHEDSMERQIRKMLVEQNPPGFKSIAAAAKALQQLKREVVCHVNEHVPSLVKVIKVRSEISRALRSQSGVVRMCPPGAIANI
jgi:hypothetical protein